MNDQQLIPVGVLAVAGCLFFGLWKLGIGEWASLVSGICGVMSVAIYLYSLVWSEGGNIKAERRFYCLMYTPLVFLAAAAIFLNFWEMGAGEWSALVGLAFFALWMLAPPVWFIVQRDLVVGLFKVTTWDFTVNTDWANVPTRYKVIICVGIIICLVMGVMILLHVFRRLSSG